MTSQSSGQAASTAQNQRRFLYRGQARVSRANAPSQDRVGARGCAAWLYATDRRWTFTNSHKEKLTQREPEKRLTPTVYEPSAIAGLIVTAILTAGLYALMRIGE